MDFLLPPNKSSSLSSESLNIDDFVFLAVDAGLTALLSADLGTAAGFDAVADAAGVNMSSSLSLNNPLPAARDKGKTTEVYKIYHVVMQLS